MLRLCWGKPCQSDYVYSLHQVWESDIRPTWYSTMVTENGPHFVTREFTEFAKHWKFQLFILSPYRPKSKRKAESAVKENLFEKALKDNKDRGWFCWIREIRLQPACSQTLSTAGMQPSLVQWLMPRRKKTPVRKVPWSWSPWWSVRQEPQEAESMTVILKQRGESWDTGTCEHKFSDRYYLVGKISSTTTKLLNQPRSLSMFQNKSILKVQKEQQHLELLQHHLPALWPVHQESDQVLGTIRRPLGF